MPYDLKSLSLPRLGTRGLALLVRVLENPLIGPWLVARLKRDAGLTRLSASDVTEPPTFFPSQPSDDPAIPALDAFDADDSPYSDAPAPPPPTPGFAFPAAEDFTRAYRAGRLTPQDVASRFIAQWNASDTGPRPLRAMIAVCDVRPPASVPNPSTFARFICAVSPGVRLCASTTWGEASPARPV